MLKNWQPVAEKSAEYSESGKVLYRTSVISCSVMGPSVVMKQNSSSTINQFT